MPAAVVRHTDTGFALQVEVPSSDSTLDAREAIQDALNQAGDAATAEALRHFDDDGQPIRFGPTKLTSMGRARKQCQPPTASSRSAATSTKALRAARPTAP